MTGINEGKLSVSMALSAADGTWVNVGSVTIPANHAVPSTDAIVEVRYLYRGGPEGALVQPVYLGERTDLRADEATLAQVRRIKAAASAEKAPQAA